MRLSLITVKRRPDSDDVSRRETLLEGAQLRVGRGADVDVNLPDVDIAYHHATLTEASEGLHLAAVGGAAIEVDGDLVESVILRPGVTARIGGFDLMGENPPEHADRAIALSTVEKEEVAADPNPQRIAEAMPSRRRLSWLLVAVVIGLFVAWPLADILQRAQPAPGEVLVSGMVPSSIAATEAAKAAIDNGEAPAATPAVFSPMETAWLSGPMSAAHAGLAEDCSACHIRPFEMTTNASCLNCHAEVAQHAEVADHPVMALENHRCAACHKEHVGGEAPIETASSICTDCHADLKMQSAKTELFDVSDFGTNHPQFRPTLVTGVAKVDGVLEPTVVRAPLDAALPLVETSGLKFPHDVHLNKDGVRGLGRVADQKWEMGCTTCHQPEADGRLMRPIQMERDCGYCHELTFKPDNVDILRELPHAKPAQVSEIVHDYYDARVLEGALRVPGAVESERRRPGPRAFNQESATASLSWAGEQAENELKAIFEVRLCGDCHVATKAEEQDERGRAVWSVAPALLQRHWMPKARFDHGPHFAMDCVSCHAATASKDSADVLMPRIELCRDCHLGEAAGQATASSECLACHGFHFEEFGPMSPAHGDKFSARRKSAESVEVTRETTQ